MPGNQVLRTKFGAEVRGQDTRAKEQSPSDLTDKIKLRGKIIENFKTVTAKHETSVQCPSECP